MSMQIKVKDTRMHKKIVTSKNTFDASCGLMDTIDIPVAEAKLVLVECNIHESLIVVGPTEMWLTKEGVYIAPTKVKFVKPILISETEKIEVGDYYYNSSSKNIVACLYEYEAVASSSNPECFKILAFPEHFSEKHLQALVDMVRLKMGDKVLVECQEWNQIKALTKPESLSFTIKLNSHFHITLHSVEKKMYSEEEVIKLLVKERDRAVEICYQSHKEHLENAQIKMLAGNKFAFVSKDIANEARELGNAISGKNALSQALGETIEDCVIRDFKNGK